MSAAIQSSTHIRRQNTARVLSELERLRPLSRTDLTEITGMSATSITRIVNQLQTMGLVREESTLPSSGRGRRAVNLDICPSGVYTAGFHAADARLYSCLMDFSRKVIFETCEPLPCVPFTARTLASSIGAFLERVTKETSAPAGRIRAVGISIPGCVDAAHGSVVRSEYLGWSGFPLADELSGQVSLPVYIENDVRACLSWEQLAKPGSVPDSIAYLYVGSSGIGFANTDRGSIVRGHMNAAGEIQDISDGYSGLLSDFMLPGKLIERAKAFCPCVSSLSDIAEAQRLGAVWANIMMNEFRAHLLKILNTVTAFMDPERVILGGDAIDAFSSYLEDVFNDRVSAGTDYEKCCASGAAGIAMGYAVQSLIEKQEA